MTKIREREREREIRPRILMIKVVDWNLIKGRVRHPGKKEKNGGDRRTARERIKTETALVEQLHQVCNDACDLFWPRNKNEPPFPKTHTHKVTSTRQGKNISPSI